MVQSSGRRMEAPDAVLSMSNHKILRDGDDNLYMMTKMMSRQRQG